MINDKTQNITDLVVELQKGNGKAFEKLYYQSLKYAYSIAKMMLGNEEDIKDVLQNAYFSVSQNINKLKNPESFESWLGVIVKHECHHFLSKQKKIGDIFVSVKKSKEFEPPDNLNLPFDFIEKKESLKLIKKVIDELPEEKRACVYLHYFEQHTVEEIAEILCVPTGTVVSRLHYARKKLEAEFQKLRKNEDSLIDFNTVPLVAEMPPQHVNNISVPAETKAAVIAAVTINYTNKSTAEPDNI